MHIEQLTRNGKAKWLLHEFVGDDQGKETANSLKLLKGC